jgi:hypothetical protein
VLTAFSPLPSRLLDYRNYQTTTIATLQRQLAMYRQIQADNADNARRLHRGRDIDFLGPYHRTPSRLILFKIAMRMSCQRRRRFTLGINVLACLLTL